MLNRKTPETLATDLTIKAPNDTFKVAVVYHNRTQEQITAYNAELTESEKGKEDIEWVNNSMFCYVVKEVDGETPTEEAVADAERRYPGFVSGVFFAFHQLRQVSVTKN